MTKGSWISADDAWAVFGALALIGWLGLRLERTPWGARLSGAVIAILLGMAAGNLGVLPATSPVHDLVWTYFLPFAIDQSVRGLATSGDWIAAALVITLCLASWLFARNARQKGWLR